MYDVQPLEMYRERQEINKDGFRETTYRVLAPDGQQTDVIAFYLDDGKMIKPCGIAAELRFEDQKLDISDQTLPVSVLRKWIEDRI